MSAAFLLGSSVSVALAQSVTQSGAQSAPSPGAAPAMLRMGAINKVTPATLAGLQRRAAAGDANAQFQLGEYLEETAHALAPAAAAVQLVQAATWYKAAADQGHGAALNNLGAMLVDGRGVPQDPQQAASYYRRGAQAGNREAQTNLALLIFKKRITGTTDEAMQSLNDAASAGFAPAQAQLAQIYLDGLWVSPDDDRAADLFRRSALQQYPWGEYGYALMLQSGSGVARDLPLAEHWMERAASAGLPVAEFDLARMLELGLGVPADKKRADALFLQAAKLGEPRAEDRLRSTTKPEHPVS